MATKQQSAKDIAKPPGYSSCTDSYRYVELNYIDPEVALRGSTLYSSLSSWIGFEPISLLRLSISPSWWEDPGSRHPSHLSARYLPWAMRRPNERSLSPFLPFWRQKPVSPARAHRGLSRSNVQCSGGLPRFPFGQLPLNKLIKGSGGSLCLLWIRDLGVESRK